MKILEFENFLQKNRDIGIEELKKYVLEHSKNLELYPVQEGRKLTEEEIDYEYIDLLITETLENLKDDICTCEHDCGVDDCCGTRVEKNLKKVYEIGLHMLKDGISYTDLTQEGFIGMMTADSLFDDDKDFKKYKDYFIVREMFNYIDDYANYRKAGYKNFAESEIHKSGHSKVSLKDKSKSDELKKLEKENEEKKIEEMRKLEKTVENLFDYSNIKYRLSEREIQALTLYFGLDGHRKRDILEVQKIMNMKQEELDNLLKDGLFKLSVVDERVEL